MALMDGDLDWWPSWAEAARIERRRMLAREKRPTPPRDPVGRFVPRERPRVGDVFVTESGLKAIRIRVPNRRPMTSSPAFESTLDDWVSVPFVSMVHGERA